MRLVQNHGLSLLVEWAVLRVFGQGAGYARVAITVMLCKTHPRWHGKDAAICPTLEMDRETKVGAVAHAKVPLDYFTVVAFELIHHSQQSRGMCQQDAGYRFSYSLMR